jgi:hypothetical protein
MLRRLVVILNCDFCVIPKCLGVNLAMACATLRWLCQMQAMGSHYYFNSPSEFELCFLTYRWKLWHIPEFELEHLESLVQIHAGKRGRRGRLEWNAAKKQNDPYEVQREVVCRSAFQEA